MSMLKYERIELDYYKICPERDCTTPAAIITEYIPEITPEGERVMHERQRAMSLVMLAIEVANMNKKKSRTLNECEILEAFRQIVKAYNTNGMKVDLPQPFRPQHSLFTRIKDTVNGLIRLARNHPKGVKSNYSPFF